MEFKKTARYPRPDVSSSKKSGFSPVNTACRLLATAVGFIYPFYSVYLFGVMRNPPMLFVVGFTTLMVTSKTNIGAAGDDIIRYMHAFRMLDDFNSIMYVGKVYLGSIDIIFLHYAWVLKQILNNNYLVFFFLIFSSLLIIAHSFRSILGKYWGITFIIFFSSTAFVYSFANAIRQGLAAALLSFFIVCLLSGKKRKTIVALTVMLLSHVTMIIFTPILLFNKIKSKYFIALLLIAFALGITGLANYMIAFINLGDTGFLMEKLGSYFDERYFRSQLYHFDTLRIIAISSICIYMYLKTKYTAKESLLINIYLYLSSIQFFFINNYLFYNRFALHRMLIESILVVIIIQRFKKNKMLYLGIIFLSFAIQATYFYFVFAEFLYAGEYSWLTMSFNDLLKLTLFQ